MSTNHAARGAKVRRGFSLVECVVIIVALAIAVPASVAFLDRASQQRELSLDIARATSLAQAVLEHVLADASSSTPGLGLPAFADGTAYVDTAVTGLRARLALLSAPYEAAGHTWTLSVGGLVDPTGVVHADPMQNNYRIVTVTVNFRDPSGADRSVPVSTMVGGI
jgi:DMSO/TMAO reductase YedYZ molybdopterin-dependent catalytic subunit